jgi:hypothetical protein
MIASFARHCFHYSAGYRRINHFKTFGLQFLRQRAGIDGRAGAHVDKNCAGLQAADNTMRLHQHFAHHSACGQHGDDNAAD